MNFLAWLDSHKTKLVGFLLVVIGGLQANTTLLQSLLSERGYAWFTVVAGAVVAGLGFLNSRQPEPPVSDNETGVS